VVLQTSSEMQASRIRADAHGWHRPCYDLKAHQLEPAFAPPIAFVTLLANRNARIWGGTTSLKGRTPVTTVSAFILLS
jgi:hypothetical protein